MIAEIVGTASFILWGATAWVCITILTILALPILGYAIGRYRPLHRAATWATWQRYDPHLAGWRKTAVWLLLSAEGLGWLLLHPVRGWRAWQHRNDPPPPRSAAVRIPGVDYSELCEGCGESRSNGQMHGPNQGYGGCV